MLYVHFIKLLLRSGNQGSLESDKRMSDLKERCAQLCIPYGTLVPTYLTVLGCGSGWIRIQNARLDPDQYSESGSGSCKWNWAIKIQTIRKNENSRFKMENDKNSYNLATFTLIMVLWGRYIRTKILGKIYSLHGIGTAVKYRGSEKSLIKGSTGKMV